MNHALLCIFALSEGNKKQQHSCAKPSKSSALSFCLRRTVFVRLDSRPKKQLKTHESTGAAWHHHSLLRAPPPPLLKEPCAESTRCPRPNPPLVAARFVYVVMRNGRVQLPQSRLCIPAAERLVDRIEREFCPPSVSKLSLTKETKTKTSAPLSSSVPQS